MKSDSVSSSEQFNQRIRANQQASRAFAAKLAQQAAQAGDADSAAKASDVKADDSSAMPPQDKPAAGV